MNVGFKQAVEERDGGEETVWSHMKRNNNKDD